MKKDVNIYKKMIDSPPLLEEPFAQPLSGKKRISMYRARTKRCCVQPTHLHADLFNTDPFTHKPFYTHTLVHTNTFTHRRFYPQTRLHTDTFRHKHMYTETLFADKSDIPIRPQFWHIEPHFVRKGCVDKSEIALLPQFLTIEPHFVRKCCIS